MRSWAGKVQVLAIFWAFTGFLSQIGQAGPLPPDLVGNVNVISFKPSATDPTVYEFELPIDAISEMQGALLLMRDGAKVAGFAMMPAKGLPEGTIRAKLVKKFKDFEMSYPSESSGTSTYTLRYRKGGFGNPDLELSPDKKQETHQRGRGYWPVGLLIEPSGSFGFESTNSSGVSAANQSVSALRYGGRLGLTFHPFFAAGVYERVHYTLTESVGGATASVGFGGNEMGGIFGFNFRAGKVSGSYPICARLWLGYDFLDSVTVTTAAGDLTVTGAGPRVGLGVFLARYLALSFEYKRTTGKSASLAGADVSNATTFSTSNDYYLTLSIPMIFGPGQNPISRAEDEDHGN